MSLVQCAVMGCSEMVREGLVRPSYSKNVHGKDLADGHRCWRCRAGQRKHIRRDTPSPYLREKLKLDEPGGFLRIKGFMDQVKNR